MNMNAHTGFLELGGRPVEMAWATLRVTLELGLEGLMIHFYCMC